MPHQNLNIHDLMRDYERRFTEARTANERSREELMGNIRRQLRVARNRFRQSNRLLRNLGRREMREAGRQHEQFRAQDEQDLISRGLASSTLLSQMRRSRDRDYQNYRRDIQDQVAQQRAGVNMQFAGLESSIFDRMSQAIQGVTNAYPDLGTYANLIQTIGTDVSRSMRGGGVSAINRPGTPLGESIRSMFRGYGGGGGTAAATGGGGGFAGAAGGGRGGGGGGFMLGSGRGMTTDPSGQMVPMIGQGGGLTPAMLSPLVGGRAFLHGSGAGYVGPAGTESGFGDLEDVNQQRQQQGGGQAAAGQDIGALYRQWQQAGPAQKIMLSQQIGRLTGGQWNPEQYLS